MYTHIHSSGSIASAGGKMPSSGRNTSAYIGGAVAAAVVLELIAVASLLVYCVIHRKQRKRYVCGLVIEF